MRSDDTKTAALFIAPFFIGFIIFQGLPFLFSFLIGFTDLRFISRMDDVRFVGLANFFRMFGDRNFLAAVRKSLYYSVLFVPGVMILSLLLAVGVDRIRKGKAFFRSVIFLPYVTNLVAVATVWTFLFMPAEGPINGFLRLVGVDEPPMWLLSPDSVIPSIVIVHVWLTLGLQFVTFMAALQNVSRELYEAADIDGAGPVRKFLSITFPCISPATFFLLIVTVIESLKNFSIIQVMTGGGPGNASRVLSMNIVREAFMAQKLGYASAQGLMMVLVVMIFTLIQWRFQKKWVNY